MRTLTSRTESQTDVTIVYPTGNVETYAEFADLETLIHEGCYIKEWPSRTAAHRSLKRLKNEGGGN